MPFGQVVVGPPGSGKTTYCNGMKQLLNRINRKTIIVNLDPANDYIPYDCDIDIRDLVTLGNVMEDYKLGPNGGLIFAIEYIEKNLDWLKEKLEDYPEYYVLFDFPGQVELFTHYRSVKNILETLEKWTYRICTVHLVDAHYCSDASKYISALLLSLSTMINLETPHINVLSKIDLIEQYGRLDFNIDFYTEVQDLSFLLSHLDTDPFASRYKALNAAMIEAIEDHSLVSFETLNINDGENLLRLLQKIDSANGYVFGTLEINQSIMDLAQSSVGQQSDFEKNLGVREKYMHDNTDDVINNQNNYNNMNNNNNKNNNNMNNRANQNLSTSQTTQDHPSLNSNDRQLLGDVGKALDELSLELEHEDDDK